MSTGRGTVNKTPQQKRKNKCEKFVKFKNPIDKKKKVWYNRKKEVIKTPKKNKCEKFVNLKNRGWQKEKSMIQ